MDCVVRGARARGEAVGAVRWEAKSVNRLTTVFTMMILAGLHAVIGRTESCQAKGPSLKPHSSERGHNALSSFR